MKKFFPLLFIIFFSCNSTQPPHEKIKTASKLWIGKWERQLRTYEATLDIINIKNDTIIFSLLAFNGANTGVFDKEVAIVENNTATFYRTYESDTCLLKFKLVGDSIIEINYERGLCNAGNGVVYDGIYTNSKFILKEEKQETLISVGIFKSERIDSTFKSLVGDSSYTLFINSTQFVFDDEDLDNLNAHIYSSGIRGLFTEMENIIMIDSANNIWAAVINTQINGNEVFYFTNREDYKNRLPKTIEHWRKRFKDYPVIYK